MATPPLVDVVVPPAGPPGTLTAFGVTLPPFADPPKVIPAVAAAPVVPATPVKVEPTKYVVKSRGIVKNPIIEKLWGNKAFSDVEIRCDGSVFHAHRAYLGAWSTVFQRMFLSGMREAREKVVNFYEIKSRTFEQMMRFMYQQEIDIKPEDYLPLLVVACEYQITALINELVSLAPDLVNEDTCCTLLEAAMGNPSEKTNVLIEQCLEIICHYFDEVTKKPQWDDLHVSTIAGIIARDDLSCEEKDVYDAIKKWISVTPERHEYFDELLEYVRFPVMDPRDLAFLDKDSHFKKSEILEDRQFEALKFFADPTSLKDTTPARFQPRFLNTVEQKWEYKGISEEKYFEYIVPQKGWYRLLAKGAKAEDGNNKRGGRGAVIEATFFLNKGDKLEFVVGGMSKKRSEDTGGGGGTFISINGRENPLLVAGGGGGTRGSTGDYDGTDASLTTSGADGVGPNHSPGAHKGQGAMGAKSSYGGGGGGWFSDGKPDGSNTNPGIAFVKGAKGGGAYGGWGGGGDTGSSGGGGGGGYSGGGAGQGAGGGGSFIRDDGMDIKKEATHMAHGMFSIRTTRRPKAKTAAK